MQCQHGFPSKVLELFSGIGGMSFAVHSLKLSPSPEIVSCDINTVANEVHSFNFPGKVILQNNLAAISPEELDRIAADVWTMSPPCQPFTCLGLQKDVDDNRSDCLRHLLKEVFPKIKCKPRFLLLENVKGFDTSRARDMLIETVSSQGYFWREFLVSPHQVGVPNSRTRYYFLARLYQDFAFDATGILREIPSLSKSQTCTCCLETFMPSFHTNSEQNIVPDFDEVSLESLLDKEPCPDLLLKPKELKYINALDIVTPSSQRTCCFTRSYGHLLQGSGSVLQENLSLDLDKIIEDYSNSNSLEKLEQLKLRFFSPDEVSRFMSFPKEFKFPLTTTRKQRYRLLGNSVNVKVIEMMLRLLFVSRSKTECF